MAINVAVLKNIVGDDDATVHEFLDLFRQTAARLRAEAHAARAAGDPRQVGAIAHKLKSSSRSVGAEKFAELCTALETSGKAGDLAAVTKEMAAFDAELNHVQAAVDAYLAARGT